jgi:hypothetical protein
MVAAALGRHLEQAGVVVEVMTEPVALVTAHQHHRMAVTVRQQILNKAVVVAQVLERLIMEQVGAEVLTLQMALVETELQLLVVMVVQGLHQLFQEPH